MEEEVVASLATLEAAMRFDALNFEGLRKILKKFDKRTGFGVSSAALADLQRRAFVADAAMAGTGRCAALRIGLQSLFRQLRSLR